MLLAVDRSGQLPDGWGSWQWQSWRTACSKDTNAERMRRINRLTKEDMQKGPSTDNQNSSMEYIAGPIEVHCRADGVFGQDNGVNGESESRADSVVTTAMCHCKHSRCYCHDPEDL